MSSIKKPNRFLYGLAGLVIRPYCKLKYKYKVVGHKIVEPTIVLCNHGSNIDFLFAFCAHYPKKLNFLAAYYWFLGKNLGRLLTCLGTIPKFQFSTDIKAIMSIKQVLTTNKGNVCLMPEGTVGGNGALGYVTPSIAKLVKYCGVDVCATVVHGTNICFPKWAKYNRTTNIQIENKLLITKQQLKEMTLDEIYKKVVDALSFDEFDYLKQNNLTVRGQYLAEGLEKLLWLCPHCKKEYSLSTNKNTIECKECGYKATLNNRMQFESSPHYFDNYLQWYEYQMQYLRDNLVTILPMQAQVGYYTDVNHGKYGKIGEGEIVVDRKGYTYTGTKNGEQVVEFTPIDKVPTVVIDSGKNFELPYDNGVRCFDPQNKASVMKWSMLNRVLFDDNCNKQKV